MCRIFMIAALLSSINACSSPTYLSDEAPYSSLTGKCYQLAQDTFIQESGCRGLGAEYLISPKENDFCFKRKVSIVEKGTKIRVQRVSQARYGTWGVCPQLDIAFIDNRTEVESMNVGVPICMAHARLSWLVPGYDYVWQRGTPIVLDEKYATPCL